MISSEEYLDALLNNDRKLLLNVYREFLPAVEKFVLNNSGTIDDAHDTFQKALFQLAVRYKNERFEVKGAFGPYLFAVCKNLWLRQINKSKNRVTDFEFGNYYDEDTDQALALLEQKRHELFLEKLNQISENCRSILALYFSKVPYPEIMVKLAYNSETVVRQRVFKCKKKLKELVRKDKRYNALREI